MVSTQNSPKWFNNGGNGSGSLLMRGSAQLSDVCSMTMGSACRQLIVSGGNSSAPIGRRDLMMPHRFLQLDGRVGFGGAMGDWTRVIVALQLSAMAHRLSQ